MVEAEFGGNRFWFVAGNYRYLLVEAAYHSIAPVDQTEAIKMAFPMGLFWVIFTVRVASSLADFGWDLLSV